MSARRLAGLALLAAAAEGVALVGLGRLRSAEALRLLLPGLCLMAAVRSAAAGRGVALPLGAALAAHLVDLRERVR